MVKLESKNLLLVRVLHSIEPIPSSLAFLELAIYAHVDG
jgi:hypothetical protein